MAAVLWAASEVLAAIEGPQQVRPMQLKVYLRFLDDLAALNSPALRRAFVTANVAHRAMTSFRPTAPRVLVQLPALGAPTGRTLGADEIVPVVWTVEAPDDPSSPRQRRHRQLERLAREATEQAAIATVEALSATLAVSCRTVLRDLDALRELRMPISTRRLAQPIAPSAGQDVAEAGI